MSTPILPDLKQVITNILQKALEAARATGQFLSKQTSHDNPLGAFAILLGGAAVCFSVPIMIDSSMELIYLFEYANKLVEGA